MNTAEIKDIIIKSMNINCIKIILGALILIGNIVYMFSEDIYLPRIAVFIVSTFGLLAISMNYKKDGKERNAWDVWFFSMPGALVTLLFVGIIASNSNVWKWVAIAIGGAIGLESLSSLIKNKKKTDNG